MTINKLIELLGLAGVQSPRLEARIIFEDWGLGDELSKEQENAVCDIVRRRKLKEPLDKILGYKGFYKANFAVDCNVLSPRADTELLLEETISILKNGDTILELGVGSGCVIISALMECVGLRGVGVDKSTKALAIARKNAATMKVEKRLKLLEKDYFSKMEFDERFNLIISNPPYIPSQDILSLDDEVKNFDPLMALDGGDDGLDHYRRIAEITPNLLVENGHLLLEIGIYQAQSVVSIFEAQGFGLVRISKDLSGIERCLVFCFKG